jgi:hypothetical protein
VRDIGGHLGPHRHPGRRHHPAADFLENLRVLPHRRAHAPFRQPMRAGEIAFERINPDRLAAFDDLDPGILAIFLHDGGDQDAVRVLVLDLLELIEPGFKGTIADELNILPANDLLGLGGAQSGIAGIDVDDLGSIQADRFADHRSPSLIKRSGNDAGVCSRRTRSDDEWIGKL